MRDPVEQSIVQTVSTQILFVMSLILRANHPNGGWRRNCRCGFASLTGLFGLAYATALALGRAWLTCGSGLLKSIGGRIASHSIDLLRYARNVCSHLRYSV